ncbi:hypothetical protein [Curtobacterium citreum]|uniref:hypothetical protein n=1 Tax=Curtobacterium citreum TaxID=2036 RepID=UPI0025428BE1|nr:hypothetical protein [Curtobacterium citreum]WIJ45583.1 hypothetical protein QPK07_01085 [Curtobacterium citreum]
MPKFPTNGGNYENVNEIAEQQGLLFDRRGGWLVVVPKDKRDVASGDDPDFGHLFDHVIRFKKRGRGIQPAVMMISSPYLASSPENRALAEEFASRTGLSVLFDDDRFRVHTVEGSVTIVFWDPNQHDLVED